MMISVLLKTCSSRAKIVGLSKANASSHVLCRELWQLQLLCMSHPRLKSPEAQLLANLKAPGSQHRWQKSRRRLLTS